MVDRIRQRSLLPIFGLTPAQKFQQLDMQGEQVRPEARVVRRPLLDVPRVIPQQKPVTRADMPLGRAALTGMVTGTSAPLPKDPTMLQRLQADKPFSAGLQAAGEALSKASGYTDMPKDPLGMINQAMAAFNQAQRQQAMFEAKTALDKQRQEQEMALEKAKLEQAMEIAKMQYGNEQTGKVIDREMKLSKDFRAGSKAFGEARLNYERVVANATTKRPTGATDIALIFNFMKMLDPTSVVRESEFQAAAGASPLLLRLGAEYNKLFRKEAEKLPDATRRQFFQAATETYVPYVEGQERLEADFRTEAERFGLNPDNVVRSKVPVKGSKEYPHIIFDYTEAEGLVGEYVMLDGTVLKVEERK